MVGGWGGGAERLRGIMSAWLYDCKIPLQAFTDI